MKRVWPKLVAAVLVVAVLVSIRVLLDMNRPIVVAPRGTAPLDNKMDTAGVAQFIVDEGEVLSEKTERIIAIYNANWMALENRVMAVVTVENAEDAEDDAWQWAQKLSLGDDDALLLVEASGGKDCALVSNGMFREDIATLDYVFLERLTYIDLHAGEFDAAVLAVFEEMHPFFDYDIESYRKSEVIEAVIIVSVLAVVTIPVLIHMIAEKIDGFRFKRWYKKYGVDDPSIVPWKTVFLWHRTGSKWYEVRISGEWIDYTSILRNYRRERTAKAANRRYR